MTALAQDVRTACEDEPELFHAPDQESPADKKWRETEAKTICAACPTAVRESCLQLAMDNERGLSAGNRWGLYGGLTEKERADLDYAQSNPNTCPECGRTDFDTPAAISQHITLAHNSDTMRRTDQIRGMAAAGLSDPEIAQELGIAVRTVLRVRQRAGIRAGLNTARRSA